MSPSAVQNIEQGRAGSLDSCARLAHALDLRLEMKLVDPRRRSQFASARNADLVHAAMGEFEARRLEGPGIGLGLDEPYQHFQFAGRADFVAWHLEQRALLHIENRTQFPDIQGMAGAWNAKRRYLPAELARRFDLPRGWASVTHVMAALWSAETMHVVRKRSATFRSLCPDPTALFEAWWSGRPPSSGSVSTFVYVDPAATGRARAFISLSEGETTRPRYRGYAHAAEALRDG